MFGRIADGVWKFTGSDKSNVYFIDGRTRIVIDTGNRTDRENLRIFMGKVVDFESVDIVIFTHMHYDHSGNFDLFPNADFYASQEAVEDFEADRNSAVLDEVVAEKLSKIQLKKLPKDFFGLKVIKTPGHTRGSICLWHEAKRLLFTGDTLFASKKQGRVDLPTSAPDQMKDSIMKIIEFPYKVLCPGHDY